MKVSTRNGKRDMKIPHNGGKTLFDASNVMYIYIYIYIYIYMYCSGIIVNREYMVMFVMTCAVCLQVLFMSHNLIITRRAIYWTTPVLLFFPLSNTIIRIQHTAMFDPPWFYTVKNMNMGNWQIEDNTL